MANKINNYLILFLFVWFTNISLALPNDESQPLMIQAKQADYDKQKGISTYQGNVMLTQGNARATGNIGIAYFDENNQIKQATLKGNLAHYWTTPKENQSELHVWGEKIDLYPDKDIVIVTGQARVEQNHDRLTGDRIVYNLTTHEVHATSNTKQRTSMTLIQKK